VRRLRQDGFSVRFGDGEDAAFLETSPLTKAGWIVTTLATWEANRALLRGLKDLASTSRIACCPMITNELDLLEGICNDCTPCLSPQTFPRHRVMPRNGPLCWLTTAALG
jgi:hypothetical protein